jgi:hypothetical protein
MIIENAMVTSSCSVSMTINSVCDVEKKSASLISYTSIKMSDPDDVNSNF